MLAQLDIENIAVIERTSIAFDKGFTALTGETGAGKSIIIDSLNAVLGERTSRELIRGGCEKAKVGALFSELSGELKAALEAEGFMPDEDGQLFIQRILSQDGKSSCRINGQAATAGVLRQISRLLVNIHGQHDSQSLLQPETHVTYLDAAADNQMIMSDYKKEYLRTVKLKKEYDRLIQSEEDKEKRTDLLEYQIRELKAAEIRPGETEELLSAKRTLLSGAKLAAALQQAYTALGGSDEGMDVLSLIAQAAGGLEPVAGYDSEIEDYVARLTAAEDELAEVSAGLRNKLEATENPAYSLDEIEARLDELYRLSHKYRKNESELLDFLAQAEAELAGLENAEERLIELESLLKEAAEKTRAAGELLTQSRMKAGKELEMKIINELKFLDMPGASFVVRREKTALSSGGADKIEFLISANPGEPPRPLAKIASGGELSRIMLAIKNVLAERDLVTTMIFDEIDTGISGRAAGKVGYKLWQTAKGRQVICVTHLAQIAAQADSQLLIKKETSGERTYTKVTELNKQGRINELARIIGGAHITESTLTSAEEMLCSAREEMREEIENGNQKRV